MDLSYEPTDDLRIVTWNVEWAPPASARGQAICRLLEDARPDVVCLTEGRAANLPSGGELVTSTADYGYPVKAGRRKVLLWTRHSWSGVDCRGHDDLPPGRFASALLEGPGPPVRFVGVCIPWSAAHVSSGRRDRARWEDHLDYLAGLSEYLASLPPLPTVILGDYNQAVPRTRQPRRVREALEDCLPPGVHTLVTTGLSDGDGLPLIDHVALSGGLTGRVEGLLPKVSAGLRLSDHAGVIARCRVATDPAARGSAGPAG